MKNILDHDYRSLFYFTVSELENPHKDTRGQYSDWSKVKLEGEKLLYLLIGETPDSFYKNMYLSATIVWDILPKEGSGPAMAKKCKLENGIDGIINIKNCNEQDFHKLLPNHVIFAKV